MTLGQNIQARRKTAGLSQEGLGEALNVSRQAISKWESDLTIPEVEKLVAMGRLFSVPVGVLLGVEEPPDPAQPTPDREELTERELEAVRTVAAHYLEAVEKRRPHWVAGVLGALAPLAMVLVVFFLVSMGDMRREMGELSRGVDRRISDLTVEMEAILERQNALVADKACTVSSIDPPNGTLTLRLSATPRQYTEGMTAQFTALLASGGTLAIPAAAGPGNAFTADWTLPAEDSIQISVVFDDGTEQRTQVLETLEGLAFALDYSVEAQFTGDCTAVSGTQDQWKWTGRVRGASRWAVYRSLDGVEGYPITATEAELRLTRNGETVKSWPQTLPFYQVDQQISETVTVAPGDRWALELYVKDNWGQEHRAETMPMAYDEAANLIPR